MKANATKSTPFQLLLNYTRKVAERVAINKPTFGQPLTVALYLKDLISDVSREDIGGDEKECGHKGANKPNQSHCGDRPFTILHT